MTVAQSASGVSPLPAKQTVGTGIVKKKKKRSIFHKAGVIPCTGNCILQYWNYSAAPSLQRCKCPICTCLINKLTPAASLTQQEEEVIKVLKNVESYNHLFVGGIHGFNQKVLQLPLVMKRMFLGLMDPSRLRLNYYLMRHLALLLSLLYEMGNFNFIPLGRKEILKFFDYCAIALVIVLCLVGFCRKQLLRRRVRLLAAAQQ